MIKVKCSKIDNDLIYSLIKIKYNGVNIELDPIEYINNEKHLILYSGGMESITMLYLLIHLGISPDNIILLNFEYDFKDGFLTDAQKYEKELILKIHDKYNIQLINKSLILPNTHNNGGIVTGSESSEDSSNYFSVRNAIMCLYAVSEAENIINNITSYKKGVNIYLGANLSESMTYSDNSQVFIDGMVKVASTASNQSYNVKFHAPLLNLLKTEIWSLGDALGVDWQLSTSCYSPNIIDNKYNDCYECGSCKLRYTAKDRSINNNYNVNIDKLNMSVKAR